MSSELDTNKTFSDYSGIRDDKVIIASLTKLVIPIMLVFGFYIQFFGEHSPGGGFQAGIIFAMIIIVYSLVDGIEKAKRMINEQQATIISILGVLIYFLTGFCTIFFQGKMFDYSVYQIFQYTVGRKFGIFMIEIGVLFGIFGAICNIYYAIYNFVSRNKS